VLAAGPAGPAGALVGDSDGPIGVDGSLRTIGAAIDNYDFPLFFGDDEWDGLSQTLLRLTVVGRPAPMITYELHGVQSVDYSSAEGSLGPAAAGGLGQSFFSLAPADVRYRALDMRLDWRQRDDHAAAFEVDRANVRLALPFADVTLGRQAISLGKTFFWNPLDVFLPFDPAQFDQEYKPGVDAVRIDVPLGAFSGVSVIGAAGRTLDVAGVFESDDSVDATWFGSSVLGRMFTSVRGWDLALQGGKVYGGYHVGGGGVGELGPIEVRLEALAHFEDDSPPLIPLLRSDDVLLVEDEVSAVVGVGHRFESSLTFEAEYFHNGAGDTGDRLAGLLRFSSGGTLGISRHLFGGLVSYEILPILLGQLIGIVSAADTSSQILPRLTWSAADEIEVLAGAIVNLGERPEVGLPFLLDVRSEFGTFPNVYYAEVKWYF
jgi:hypothetical protein